MTQLQARLLAARAVQAAQAQEDFARRLRPEAGIPAQRTAEDEADLALTFLTRASA